MWFDGARLPSSERSLKILKILHPTNSRMQFGENYIQIVKLAKSGLLMIIFGCQLDYIWNCLKLKNGGYVNEGLLINLK